MSKKIGIKMKKLFTVCDIELSFNNNLNIIAGENGCGKSTILRMINNVINNNFIELIKVPFDTIEFSIDNTNKTICYSELEQLEMSKNPEFRFAVKESLEQANTFNDFIDVLTEKAQSFKKYSLSYDDKEYALSPDRYLIDDEKIYCIKNYIFKMSKSRCVYGSRYYLRQLFYVYNNKISKLIEFKVVKSSLLYSFINLDNEFYNFENVNIINRFKVLSVLRRFMPNKLFKFKNNILYVYNKNTNLLIPFERLSSGEKKIIQFYKSINSLKNKTLLLLDEPELSLSYKWSENLIELLKTASQKTKIIIATQQPQITKEEDLELLVPIL